MSTAGLTPTQRCIELRQRALSYSRRLPIRFIEQKLDNLFTAVSRAAPGSACGQWDEQGNGDICVFHGGGWHLDSQAKQYELKRGYVVAIGREKSE